MKERTTPNALVRRGIEEVMPAGKRLNVQEIKEMLEKEKGLVYLKDYSEGNISNALYVLSNMGVLKKVQRGIYQKVDIRERRGETSNREERNETGRNAGNEKEKNTTYEIKEVLELFQRDKEKLKEISDEICTALKNVDLSNGATDREFERLKLMLAYKDAILGMLEKFEI